MFRIVPYETLSAAAPRLYCIIQFPWQFKTFICLKNNINSHYLYIFVNINKVFVSLDLSGLFVIIKIRIIALCSIFGIVL